MLVVMGLVLAMAAGAAFALAKVGAAGRDRLVGTAENDVLRDSPGNDTLIGRGDSDRLFGGRGRDFINARSAGTPKETSWTAAPAVTSS